MPDRSDTSCNCRKALYWSADQYNAFLQLQEVSDLSGIQQGDQVVTQGGKTYKPVRLPNGLYAFKDGSGEDRCVLDCITALQNGADLLWIETERPHVGQIGGMVSRIREVIPNAKLVYNNSPSFNWTLNFRNQVHGEWVAAGKDVSADTSLPAATHSPCTWLRKFSVQLKLGELL